MNDKDIEFAVKWVDKLGISSAERTKFLSCRGVLSVLVPTLRGYKSTEQELKEALSELKEARDVLAPIPDGEAKNKVVSVAQIHPATGKVIEKFQSIADAARAIGRHHCVISDVLSGRTQHGGGYKWRRISRRRKCLHCKKLKTIKNFRKTNSEKSPHSSKCFECEPKVHKIERTVRNLIRRENHLREYAKSVTLIIDGVADHLKKMRFQDSAILLAKEDVMKELLSSEKTFTANELASFSIQIASAISDNIIEGDYQKVIIKINKKLNEMMDKNA